MASISSLEHQELRSTDDAAANTMNDIEAQNDPLIPSITNRLAALSPDVNGAACIYKVPKRLRDVNEKCYTPRVVSLGPYTHGMKGLEFMENVKLRYLRTFVKWSKMSIEGLVRFTREREAKARACYASFINFDSDKFVDILLVDAAFVLTHLLKKRYGRRIFSHFFENGAISRSDLFYDLNLLENQLPLFFLQELFEAASLSNKFEYSFRDVLRTLRAFDELVSDERIPPEDKNRSRFLHLVDLFRECHKPSKPRSGTSYTVPNPQSLTELHEAGVKFKVSSSKKLLDIQFNDGMLEIPRIEIQDSTETILRNIVAFEQCHRDLLEARYVTDYIVAMSTLVKTPRDAKLLVQHGILRNNIGDNKQVSNFFHILDKNIYYNKRNFYYARLFEQLDAHCQISWKKWYASLKHEYFNNPWKTISVIAAGILLILTLIQTICSIISVARP